MSSPAPPPVLDLTADSAEDSAADSAEVIDLTADTAADEVIDLTDGFPDGNIPPSFWQDVYERLVALGVPTNIVDLTAAEEE